MVLLTTVAQSPSSSMSWLGLDRPMDHLVWNPADGVWSCDGFRDNVPQSSASPRTTPTTPTTLTASTTPAEDTVKDFELMDGKVHCYIYIANHDLSNWHSDHVGASLPLTKQHTRLVCASL